MGQSVRRNSRTIVRDFEHCGVALSVDVDFDLAALLRVFDGVVNEVHNDLLQAGPVPFHVNHGWSVGT